MVNIIFKKYRDTNKYYAFKSEGHANYNIDGPDILCAGISTVEQVIINKIMVETPSDGNRLIIGSGLIDFKVSVNQVWYDRIQCLFECLRDGLKQLEAQYPDNISIIEEEIYEDREWYEMADH